MDLHVLTDASLRQLVLDATEFPAFGEVHVTVDVLRAAQGGGAKRELVVIRRGEFRGIQFQLTQSGVGQDMEIHSITAGLKGGAVSLEN